MCKNFVDFFSENDRIVSNTAATEFKSAVLPTEASLDVFENMNIKDFFFFS